MVSRVLRGRLLRVTSIVLLLFVYFVICNELEAFQGCSDDFVIDFCTYTAEGSKLRDKETMLAASKAREGVRGVN